MKKSKKRNSKWEWYSVKNLFKSTINGEPNNNKIDGNYTDSFMTYEESIVIVKAQSYDHAYKVAERIAKKNEIDYLNPYDQMVQYRFIKSLDCFQLFDSKIKIFNMDLSMIKTKKVMSKGASSMRTLNCGTGTSPNIKKVR